MSFQIQQGWQDYGGMWAVAELRKSPSPTSGSQQRPANSRISLLSGFSTIAFLARTSSTSVAQWEQADPTELKEKHKEVRNTWPQIQS